MTLPDIASLSTYGGEHEDEAPVEDELTDLGATEFNQLACDVAGMTQTACRAWVSLVGKASSPPDDPSSNVHGAVWGNDNAVKPTMARTGAGVFTATWSATITDELGEVRSVNLRRAWATVEGSTPYFVTATVTAPNVVTIRVFNAAGAANDAVGVTITAFAV